MNHIDTLTILGSAERASRDSLSLYYRLHRQGRDDLEYIAWVMFLEASWSADQSPVDLQAAKAILGSAEKGMHLALALDRVLSREGNRLMETARRIYRDAESAALALGKALNLEVALPD